MKYPGINGSAISNILMAGKMIGTGHNMFAVRELSDTSTNAFNGLAYYHYYIGDAKFSGGVTNITKISAYTFVSFDDGKMLKIKGAGGGGHDMFAVDELPYNSTNAFNGEPGYPYYVGDAKFSSAVTAMRQINNQILIGFADGKMLKIKGAGGSGHDMFAVDELPYNSTNAFNGEPGYPYYAGDAKFSSGVTNIIYINGYTFITFSNGNMLKVNGTGGGGHDMFAVRELPYNSTNAFNGEPGYPYYVGDAKFRAAVKSINHISSQTLIGFTNGKILKVYGAGGSGHDMFAVDELPGTSPNAFNGEPGYPYYAGDAKFLSGVTSFIDVDGFTIVTFSNGKMLKIEGAGGGGHNMFAVTELPDDSVDAFTGLPGYDYYVGDAKFRSAVTAFARYGEGRILFGFKNGKILGVNEPGGKGHNMFAVTELPSTSVDAFTGLSGYPYYVGDAKFSSKINSLTRVGTVMFVCLDNGKMLKVDATF